MDWVKEHRELLLGSAAFSAVTLYILNSRRQRGRLPPGPRFVPFLQSSHNINFDDIHKDFTALAKEYGDIVTIYIDSYPFIVLNSFDVIKEAFNMKEFSGRADCPQYRSVMNEEVFMGTYSENWRMAKKHGLTAIKKFSASGTGLDDILLKEADFLKETFTNNAGTPVDPYQVMRLTCTNTMCFAMFGKHYDHNDPELHELSRNLEIWYEAFQDMSPQCEFYSEDKMGTLYPDAFRARVVSSTFLREYVKATMKHLKDSWDPANPKSFLEHFMAKRDMASMGGIDGFADTIALYTIDPVDTNARLFQWIVFYLAYFPDVQAKLQQAIDKLVQPNQKVTNKERHSLGLLESFILEVQRHSSFTRYSFLHTVTDDVVFHGYTIPKDTGVIANTYAVHMNPDLFSSPKEFKFDRFVDSTGIFTRSDAILTHTIGIRQCPGMAYTKNHMFIMTANLIHDFNIVFPANREKPSLSPQNEAPACFLFSQPYKVVFNNRC